MRLLQRLTIALIPILALAAPTQALAESSGVSSSWASDFGKLNLQINENLEVSGRYNHKNGQVTGRMTVNGRISAYWLQSSAGRRCNHPVYGTYYWGVVTWDVAPNGNLNGYWSYCDQRASSGGAWGARLQSGLSPMVLVSSAGSPPPPIHSRRAPAPAPTTPEAAFANLLQALARQ